MAVELWKIERFANSDKILFGGLAKDLDNP
jgi:hypothetical protein